MPNKTPLYQSYDLILPQCANYVDVPGDVLDSVEQCVSASCTAMPASLDLNPFLEIYTTSVAQVCPIGINRKAYTGEAGNPLTTSSATPSTTISSSSSGSVITDITIPNHTVTSSSNNSSSTDISRTTHPTGASGSAASGANVKLFSSSIVFFSMTALAVLLGIVVL